MLKSKLLLIFFNIIICLTTISSNFYINNNETKNDTFFLNLTINNSLDINTEYNNIYINVDIEKYKNKSDYPEYLIVSVEHNGYMKEKIENIFYSPKPKPSTNSFTLYNSDMKRKPKIFLKKKDIIDKQTLYFYLIMGNDDNYNIEYNKKHSIIFSVKESKYIEINNIYEEPFEYKFLGGDIDLLIKRNNSNTSNIYDNNINNYNYDDNDNIINKYDNIEEIDNIQGDDNNGTKYKLMISMKGNNLINFNIYFVPWVNELSIQNINKKVEQIKTKEGIIIQINEEMYKTRKGDYLIRISSKEKEEIFVNINEFEAERDSKQNKLIYKGYIIPDGYSMIVNNFEDDLTNICYSIYKKIDYKDESFSAYKCSLDAEKDTCDEIKEKDKNEYCLINMKKNEPIKIMLKNNKYFSGRLDYIIPYEGNTRIENVRYFKKLGMQTILYKSSLTDIPINYFSFEVYFQEGKKNIKFNKENSYELNDLSNLNKINIYNTNQDNISFFLVECGIYSYCDLDEATIKNRSISNNIIRSHIEGVKEDIYSFTKIYNKSEKLNRYILYIAKGGHKKNNSINNDINDDNFEYMNILFMLKNKTERFSASHEDDEILLITIIFFLIIVLLISYLFIYCIKKDTENIRDGINEFNNHGIFGGDDSNNNSNFSNNDYNNMNMNMNEMNPWG